MRCFVLTLVMAWSQQALWATPQVPGDPRLISAKPASAPTPSLKYRLLPASTELTPGNAATLYYRTFSFLTEAPNNFKNTLLGGWQKDDKGEEYSQVERWLKMPLKDMPQQSVEEFLGMFSTYIRELTQATHRQSCDWEVNGRPEGLMLLLPEVQSFRSIANIVTLKARLQIAKGEYEKAIQTLQINFKLAEHLSRGPTVIHTLVGIAIARISLNQVEAIIEANDSPNLYWALSTLPSPYSDLKQAVELEPDNVFRLMPSLKEMENGPASAELMAALKEDKKAFRNNLGIKKDFPEPIMIGGALPEAKANLLAAGIKPEVLEKMPQQQIVLIDAMRRHRTAHQELSKWLYLPYAQSGNYGDKELTAFKESCARLDLLLFDSVLERLGYYEGHSKARQAGATLDRQISALRCIEAIRMQAAADGGKLPKQLNEVHVVPVPIDPMTGTAFQYLLEGNKATIHSPGPTGKDEKRFSLTYVITFIIK